MVTLRDIANASGVSCGTVSSILNGKAKKARIGDKTTALILEKARDLGYMRDDMAHAVRTGTSNVIGFLGFDCTYEFSAALLVGCMQKAKEKGCLIYQIPMENYTTPEAVAMFCIKNRLAGVVYYNTNTSFFSRLSKIFAESKKGIRIVTVSHVSESPLHVGTDDEDACIKTVDYLYSLGHRKIAIAGIPEEVIYNNRRINSFIKGIKNHGLPLPEEYIVRVKMDASFSALKDLLLSKRAPTAICCVSDFMAVGILETALAAGINVPENLSIFGYGDLKFSIYTKPPLSTIREKHFCVGHRAIDLLLSGATDANELLQSELIIRDSTAKPKTQEILS